MIVLPPLMDIQKPVIAAAVAPLIAHLAAVAPHLVAAVAVVGEEAEINCC